MERSPLEYGPELERGYLTAGVDYYKPTMSQLAYEYHPDEEVTFSFKNRGEQRLLDYIDPATLEQRLRDIRDRGFNEEELAFLSKITNSHNDEIFGEDYVDYLRTSELPAVEIAVEDDDLAIRATGEWAMVTFWETVVMSEVNELYFENYIRANNLDVFEIYNEGDRRLTEKIAILKQNPDIKFADFGTRRHFSHKWQKHVLERLQAECPDNLLGTSNVNFARQLGMQPIGTFAHEMPMVYAGMADQLSFNGENIRGSHNQMLMDWYGYYGEPLSVALTDTFGSDFFFEDFSATQAREWRGLRHDSGDPVEFGEKALAFYEAHNIDPATKTIVFSDGLDMDEIARLHEYFKDRVNVVFGWGTTLTNDLGLKPLNIVMKATEVNGTPTVKLSDNPGKHTGPDEKITEYQQIFQKEEAIA